MYAEDDLLSISALQHLLFCERQAALIHVERLWAENRLTTEGRHLHKKAHDGPAETRPGCRTVRALPLHSFALGLHGVADIVEFTSGRDASATDTGEALTVQHAEPGEADETDTPDEPPHAPAQTVRPVEYKRGRSKVGDCDRVQLCAQAMCLEEMLDLSIDEGTVFYGQTRRREPVSLTADLRQQTRNAAARLHELIDTGTVPRVEREPKCDRCSLLHLCLPDATRPNRSASQYLQRTLNQLARDTPSS